MSATEKDQFLKMWEWEAGKTIEQLKALPDRTMLDSLAPTIVAPTDRKSVV